jgi:hypothetical protein
MPTGEGAHLPLRMEIQLRGPLGLALPIVRRRMQRELKRDIATIKATLEAPSGPLNALGKKERGRITRQGVGAPTWGARRCGCVDPSETAVSWMPPQAMEASTGLP